MTTLIAVVSGVAFLGEPFTASFAVGGVMVLSGVGVILLRSGKRPIVEVGPPHPAS